VYTNNDGNNGDGGEGNGDSNGSGDDAAAAANGNNVNDNNNGNSRMPIGRPQFDDGNGTKMMYIDDDGNDGNDLFGNYET
jgi:hypothetical protein